MKNITIIKTINQNNYIYYIGTYNIPNGYVSSCGLIMYNKNF